MVSRGGSVNRAEPRSSIRYDQVDYAPLNPGATQIDVPAFIGTVDTPPSQLKILADIGTNQLVQFNGQMKIDRVTGALIKIEFFKIERGRELPMQDMIQGAKLLDDKKTLDFKIQVRAPAQKGTQVVKVSLWRPVKKSDGTQDMQGTVIATGQCEIR
jgi:hypothetical protein